MSTDNSAAPLNTTGGAFSAVAGSAFSGVVAHITDGDVTALASDYGVSLDWGDGQVSAGSVSAAPGGGFDIKGTHTYTAVGSDTVSWSVSKVNGRTASGTTTANRDVDNDNDDDHDHHHASGSSEFRCADQRRCGKDRHPARLVVAIRWQLPMERQRARARQLRCRDLGTDDADVAGRHRYGPPTAHRTLGGSVATTQRIVVRPTSTASDAADVRTVRLPPVAVCQSAPGDPRGARVAPAVAYAPGAGCTTQIKSGVDSRRRLLNRIRGQHSGDVRRSPARAPGQPKGDPAGRVRPASRACSSAADTSALLQDVENALNPPQPRLCVDSQGNDYICSTVGEEQQPVGPRFGGAPVEAGGPVAEQVARAAPNRVRTAAAGARSIAFAGNACVVAPSKQSAGETECLDLWVSTGPVRINGIDYAPAPGEEVVVVPQFNLLVSQRSSTSLDGLLLGSDHPFKLINFALPPGAAGGGGSPGVDYPALTVPNLPAEIARQRSLPNAAAIIAKLGAVGGFPSVGGLEIAFADDTAIVTLHVQLPAPFNGGDGPVTAAVQARIGPSEPFHVVYGYLGDTTGGSKVDLGPVALDRLRHLLPRPLQPGRGDRSMPRNHQHRRRGVPR